ncbi:hypothetical protein CFC21_054247 [Triticum aestivum]|uniref:Phospholipase D n=2 Tax=Triticum aestivum TaxID=4565 RepID=A0A9R1GE20_WHEAT|nr:hypothetical protein CFC21_054247 [Triticum aestivum]
MKRMVGGRKHATMYMCSVFYLVHSDESKVRTLQPDQHGRRCRRFIRRPDEPPMAASIGHLPSSRIRTPPTGDCTNLFIIQFSKPLFSLFLGHRASMEKCASMSRLKVKNGLTETKSRLDAGRRDAHPRRADQKVLQALGRPLRVGSSLRQQQAQHLQAARCGDSVYAPSEMRDCRFAGRKITAFLGGLDLCDGRYDTPEHRLFKDLDTVFHQDFHNPTFPVTSSSPGSYFLLLVLIQKTTVNLFRQCELIFSLKTSEHLFFSYDLQVHSYGPRQPWHDLHCKIEGPAAYDILTNFQQRWRKATKWRVNLKKVVIWHYDTLIKIKRMPWIVSPSTDEADARVCHEQDTENWHVQVFRSIDSGSVKGFPKLVQEAQSQCIRESHQVCTTLHIHREPVLHWVFILLAFTPKYRCRQFNTRRAGLEDCEQDQSEAAICGLHCYPNVA